MKLKSFILLFFTLLFSCYNEDVNEIKVIKNDRQAKEIKGELLFPVITRLASDIYEVDSLLLVCTPFEKKSLFSLYSKNNGKLISIFEKRGNGPNEFIQPSIHKLQNNMFSLWDSNKEYAELKISSKESKIHYKILDNLKFTNAGLKLYKFNNDIYISVINPDGMFILMDPKGKEISKDFTNNPLADNRIGYDNLQGQIDVCSQGNYFVYGTSKLGYLCFYEVMPNSSLNLKWHCYLNQEPFYELNGNKVIWNKDKHLQGIKDIQIIDDKILILYSGRSISLPGNTPEGAFSDNLILLNKEGKIFETYFLDKPVLKVHFSNKDNALYGITMNRNEWYIVKYSFLI